VIQFDDRTKEKLFMLFVCTPLALSFIYKIPKMVETWNRTKSEITNDEK